MMNNHSLASIFQQMAESLDSQEPRWKIWAYRLRDVYEAVWDWIAQQIVYSLVFFLSYPFVAIGRAVFDAIVDALYSSGDDTAT